MIIEPESISRSERYKLAIGSILPRPIAWVSTMDPAGGLNLAPFSFFTIACVQPLTLLFCPQIDDTPAGKKDTLRNIESWPEFVVNIPNEATAVAMNMTATPLPSGQSEFEWAGVTPSPSHVVTVPRVKEAPIAFECRLQRVVYVNEAPGGAASIYGQVVAIHLAEEVYQDGYVLLEQLRPIGRLAGAQYARVSERFSLSRVPYESQ